jgi:ubiquinone/menaquinone biosynthesis C-methylase UbiE
MSYKKQHELGLAGMALLRNWLVGSNKDAKQVLKEMQVLTKIPLSVEKISSFNTSNGYKAWSKTYDSMPNLLIEVEEPVVRSLIKNYKPGDAMDVACGTGRYSEYLNSLGHKVTGIDISSDMLFKARKYRNKNIKFLRGNFTKIPAKNNSFDLIVCTLALTHIPNIDKVFSEISRILRPKGHIIISDIHPWLVALGGQAEFFDESGKHSYIQNYIHWHSDYFKSFNEFALKIVNLLEPKMEQKHIHLASIGFDLNKKTVEIALKDLPITIVWLLEKA